jgi:phage RecT family recombinase
MAGQATGKEIVKAADSEQLAGALKKAHSTLVTFLGTPEMAQRAARVAWVLVRRTPDLQKCSIESIVAGILQSAQYKLELGTEAYLVPFGTEAQFIPDWKGLVRLGIRAGAITAGHADLVYDKDKFTYRRSGEAVEFFHEPQPFGQRSAQDTVEAHRKAGCVGVYFIGYRVAAPPIVQPMSVDEVEYVRTTYSKAPSGDLWKKRWSMGAFKTAAKQGMKLAATSKELLEVIELDNRQETGIKTAVLEGDEIEVRPLTEPRPALSPPAPQPTEEQVRAEEAKMVRAEDAKLAGKDK